MHERIILLTVKIEDIPFIEDEERVKLEKLAHGFYRLIVRYGFKETPNIPGLLGITPLHGLPFELMETSFFFSRETLVPTIREGMMLWREKLFIWMSRNAASAMDFFKIPTNRVVELGTQIEL